MSIMMAVDLLGCTGSTEERAALLHKTIQLAAELKSNLGNMFGFAAVMRALELPQVRQMQVTIISTKRFQWNAFLKFFVVSLFSSDFSPGADVGDATPKTHRGRYFIREETQTFLEECERWKR